MAKFGFLVVLMILLSNHIFGQNIAWFVEESAAKEYATKNNVPLLVIFAGSDWCRPCMMLKKDVLTSKEFSDYLPSHFALLYLDFPAKKKNKLSRELTAQNEKYAELFNKSGAFPNIVIIDVNGKKLGSITYRNQKPGLFIDECNIILKDKTI